MNKKSYNFAGSRSRLEVSELEQEWESTPEQKLYAAVLHRQILDALTPVMENDENERKFARLRKSARDWLLKSQEDFETVCAFADLDAGAVRDYARRVIAEMDMP